MKIGALGIQLAWRPLQDAGTLFGIRLQPDQNDSEIGFITLALSIFRTSNSVYLPSLLCMTGII